MFLTRSIFFLFLLSLSSCATIVHGSKQNIIFVSEPRSAHIKVDGEDIGLTPMRARLERGTTHKVSIELAGYQPYEVLLTHHLNGWVAGNIVIGGVIGFIIDMITGSIYTLKPDDIFATLPPKAITQKKSTSIYVSLVAAPQNGWVKIGQLQQAANRSK